MIVISLKLEKDKAYTKDITIIKKVSKLINRPISSCSISPITDNIAELLNIDREDK